MRKNFTRPALFAGLAGGLAELVWITGYSIVVGADGWQVARAVAEVVVPVGAAWPATPTLGIVIHFLLSLLLAGVFTAYFLVSARRRRSTAVTVTISMATLAVVWAVNFLVILPAVHPAFVYLLPYPVTLLSKLFFGLAMGWTLAAARSAPACPAASTPMAVPAASV